MKPITILALLLPLLCPAKTKNKKKGYNILSPSYSVHSFNDAHKTSTWYDGTQPDNYIFPQKGTGHCWGLHYERVTRWGFLYSVGILTGTRNYNIDIRRDLTGFDPEAIKTLDGYVWEHNITATTQYVGTRYVIGYRQKIHKNWAATIKIANGSKRFTTGDWSNSLYLGTYPTDNGDFQIIQLANIQSQIGSPDVKIDHGNFYTKWRSSNPSATGSYELYLGIERTMNLGAFKYLSFGVEGGRLWLGKPKNQRGTGELQITAFSAPSGGRVSRDDFYDQNIWMGIRVAAGFWWR
jgi:hypothetical protein